MVEYNSMQITLNRIEMFVLCPNSLGILIHTTVTLMLDENGKHCEDESDNGTSQAKRFAKCTSNKVLCEVCSKPDCGECSNCL